MDQGSSISEHSKRIANKQNQTNRETNRSGVCRVLCHPNPRANPGRNRVVQDHWLRYQRWTRKTSSVTCSAAACGLKINTLMVLLNITLKAAKASSPQVIINYNTLILSIRTTSKKGMLTFWHLNAVRHIKKLVMTRYFFQVLCGIKNGVRAGMQSSSDDSFLSLHEFWPGISQFSFWGCSFRSICFWTSNALSNKYQGHRLSNIFIHLQLSAKLRPCIFQLMQGLPWRWKSSDTQPVQSYENVQKNASFEQSLLFVACHIH